MLYKATLLHGALCDVMAHLRLTHPALCEEWSERNEKGPEHYTHGSDAKVWWRCNNPTNCGCHEWRCTVHNRTKANKPTGCPYCSKRARKPCEHNNLLVAEPDLCKEWSSENANPPTMYSVASNAVVWWECRNNPCGCHRWRASIRMRSRRKSGCPYCSRPARPCSHNNLLLHRPELCEEWSKKNKKSPQEYSTFSLKKVWWECKNNSCGCHVWEASICSRTVSRSVGCPYCAINGRPCIHNNLMTHRPDLREEWSVENKKAPEEYSIYSNAKVRWTCKKHTACDCHHWDMRIFHRTRGGKSGCPYCCSKKKPCKHNNLLTNRPDVCKEWSDRNDTSPDAYSVSSGKKAWWTCSKNASHEWITAICCRTNVNGSSCPHCRLSKGEEMVREVLERRFHLVLATDKSDIMDMTYYREYSFEGSSKRYDFLGKMNSSPFVIEFDGEQHFRDIPHFARKRSLEERQCVDVDKTLYALEMGYKVIRIDYTCTNEDAIASCLSRAFALRQMLCLSTTEMYDYLTCQHNVERYLCQ